MNNRTCLIALVVCCVALTTATMLDRIPLDETWANTMYWGSYKPGHYFGLKTREEKAIDVGMLINQAHRPETLKHLCSQDDDLQRYGWLMHDGTTFGDHELSDTDTNLQLISSFTKWNNTDSTVGGGWSIRHHGTPLTAAISHPFSLFTYVSVGESDGKDYQLNLKGRHAKGVKGDVQLTGKTPHTGQFNVHFRDGGIAKKNLVPVIPKHTKASVKSLPDLSRTHFLGVKISEDERWRVGDIVEQKIKQSYSKLRREYQTFVSKQQQQGNSYDPHEPLLIGTLPNTIETGANLIILQRVLQTPFELDITLIPTVDITTKTTKKPSQKVVDAAVDARTRSSLTTRLDDLRQQYQDRFARQFQLEDKKIHPTIRTLVYPWISNMIGGMGYFYGQSVVKHGEDQPPMLSPPMGLFTGVPCRPFFPRGFLWDEGFHNLLISEWDPRITIDSMTHWLNLVDPDGWIAREQILGVESRSRVPREFVPQSTTHANPPSFFLTIRKLMQQAQKAEEREHDATHHNGGESVGLDSETNFVPASVYRAFFVNAFDRLALFLEWYTKTQFGSQPGTFRWRGRTVNHTFTSGLDDYPRAKTPSSKELHVDLLSWMIMSNGVMGDLAEFLGRDPTEWRQNEAFLSDQLSLHWNPAARAYSDIAEYTEKRTHFATHLGYVSLFPLMLELLPVDSTKVLYTLKLLQDTSRLASAHGIRSLSRSDPLFGTNENYWRGPVWINMNYLILSALHNKYMKDGPYKETAAKIYTDLREKLTITIAQEYRNTGYLWEQYDPDTGAGKGAHPFTGWTALVVNIVAEQY